MTISCGTSLAGDNVTVGARLAGHAVATTNLWYARLCKNAASHGGGALLGGWGEAERHADRQGWSLSHPTSTSSP